MSRLRDPVLFSEHFSIDRGRLSELGVLDVTLNADTRLFIDPLLLSESSCTILKTDGVRLFEEHFGKIIRLLSVSKDEYDIAWRNADRLFQFPELKEICLGYGGENVRGSAIGPKLRLRLLHTAKEIVDLGIKDPELFAILGLLENDIGADRISDMTANVIIPALIKFNEEVILPEIGINTETFLIRGKTAQLVRNPYEKKPTGILFVPRDVLRELPTAHDWSDIDNAAGKNQELRDRINERIGEIWKARTRAEKQERRQALLSSREAFENLLNLLRQSTKEPYDPNVDVNGHYLWRDIHARIATEFPKHISAPTSYTLEELERVAMEIIEQFRFLVEDNGLSYLLWHNGQRRNEKAAQRLFFGIADSYCKANNLDVSPETDSGAGPVDFKFSRGYQFKVLVEIKLSTGKVVHGYKTQLEIYKTAERTFRGILLIIDVGGMGEKLEAVNRIRNENISKGLATSKVRVVDGNPRASASHR